MLVLAAGLLLAGCGGSSSTTSPKPNAAQIQRDVGIIFDQCDKKGFGVGSGGITNSKVSLAVDDLIRNFKIAPNERLNLGGLKAHTPRGAIEAALTFVEGEGINGQTCSEASANRINEALVNVHAPTASEGQGTGAGKTTETKVGSAPEETPAESAKKKKEAEEQQTLSHLAASPKTSLRVDKGTYEADLLALESGTARSLKDIEHLYEQARTAVALTTQAGSAEAERETVRAMKAEVKAVEAGVAAKVISQKEGARTLSAFAARQRCFQAAKTPESNWACWNVK